MTNITSTARTKSYTGNGTAGPFDFSFQINSFTEVKVFVDATLKTAGVHYNVENSSSESSKINADGTGRVRFTSGNFPTNSQTITIVSNVPLSRTSVYTTGGPITASSLETDFDTSLMHHQQISTRIDRTIGVPEGEPDTVSMTLPAVSQRANRFLRFDANGNVTTTITASDLAIGSSIIFEGATANEYETTVTVTDPTADRTWTIPDVTDTFVGTTATQSLSNKTLTNTAITSFSSSASHTGGVGIGIDAHGHSVGVSIGKNAGRTQGLDSFVGTPYKSGFGTDWDTDGTISIGFSATEDIRGKGKYNVAIGYEALQYIGANQPFFTNFDNGAGDNIAIGRFALKNTDFTGYGNVALGAGSGSTITTGDGNTMLGFNTEPSSATATAEFKIGAYNTDILDKVTYMSGTASGTVGTVLVNNHLTVGGNLTVNGDTVTVNTATLSVEDPLIILAKANNSSDSLDIGFYGLYDTSGSQDLYAGLFRDANDSGKWKLFKDLQSEPTTTVDTSGTGYTVGTLVANVEGNVTGDVTGDVTGNVSGTAGIATSITASANNSTDETVFPTFVDGATGTQGLETDTDLTYNPSTGVLTATQFTGTLAGNATSATTATTATNANHVSVADNENTDENNLIPFIEDGSATGNVGLESDGDLTYNPSTGRLSATQLAGTLQTASQTNITGVGTISTGVWNATAIADAYISSSATWNAKVDTGGTGLTKVGTTLNVDSSQPGITSLGTLTSLSLGDSSFLNIGAGNDLQLYHNSANSIILNNTGVFYIISAVGDMELRASGGDGGNDPYVILDASEGETKLNYVSSGVSSTKLTTKTDGVEITGDLTAKTSDGAILKLQTSDTTVSVNDVIGGIEFSAPDEASGTDAILTSASIVAEADNNFGATGNPTDLVFKLGTSEVASEKMRLTHEGDLSVKASDGAILKLQTSETAVNVGDVLGAIEFSAPDESSGGDADDTAFSITAFADSTYTNSSNKADLVFKADTTEVMRVEHQGNMVLGGNITAKDSSGAVLNLQTSIQSVGISQTLGAIQFQAPDETSGGDANNVAASIVAQPTTSFTSTNNSTDLIFKLGVSGTATEKMRLEHGGTLKLGSDTVATREQLKGDATNGAGVFSNELIARKLHTGCILTAKDDSSQVMIAGRPMGGFFSQLDLAGDRIYFMPIMIPGTGASGNFTVGGFQFRTGFSGTITDRTVKMGLYTLNTQGYPSQLISKSSASSGTSTGADINATPDVTSITPGRYALALVPVTGSTRIITNFNSSSAGASLYQEGFTDVFISGRPTGLALDGAMSSGNLPTDLSSTSGYSDQSTVPYMIITYGSTYTGE